VSHGGVLGRFNKPNFMEWQLVNDPFNISGMPDPSGGDDGFPHDHSDEETDRTASPQPNTHLSNKNSNMGSNQIPQSSSGLHFDHSWKSENKMENDHGKRESTTWPSASGWGNDSKQVNESNKRYLRTFDADEPSAKRAREVEEDDLIANQDGDEDEDDESSIDAHFSWNIGILYHFVPRVIDLVSFSCFFLFFGFAFSLHICSKQLKFILCVCALLSKTQHLLIYCKILFLVCILFLICVCLWLFFCWIFFLLLFVCFCLFFRAMKIFVCTTSLGSNYSKVQTHLQCAEFDSSDCNSSWNMALVRLNGSLTRHQFHTTKLILPLGWMEVIHEWTWLYLVCLSSRLWIF
jgi:hypothetical protein